MLKFSLRTIDNCGQMTDPRGWIFPSVDVGLDLINLPDLLRPESRWKRVFKAGSFVTIGSSSFYRISRCFLKAGGGAVYIGKICPRDMNTEWHEGCVFVGIQTVATGPPFILYDPLKLIDFSLTTYTQVNVKVVKVRLILLYYKENISRDMNVLNFLA